MAEWLCLMSRLIISVFTELVWFGSRVSLHQLKPKDRDLEIGPTDVVRDLGVLLDSELTMKRNTSAGQSALVSTIFDDYGSLEVMLTRKPWSNWCVPLFSVASTTATTTIWSASVNYQPSTKRAECRVRVMVCPSTLSCPFGTDRAQLAAS